MRRAQGARGDGVVAVETIGDAAPFRGEDNSVDDEEEETLAPEARLEALADDRGETPRDDLAPFEATDGAMDGEETEHVDFFFFFF